MIDLSGLTPFASGGNRHCYRHPDDPEKCVKVMRPGRIEELRGRAPWYKRLAGEAHFDDNLRELAGYRQRALRRAGNDNPVWHHLPRWYGIQETSAGPGAVSQLILDHKGEPAPTLEHYLQQHGLDTPITAALERFARWLRDTGVLTKNLLPHNLVVTMRQGAPELTLIDGLGRATLLPFPEWFRWSRRRYIRRRIERMWRRIHWEVSDKSLSWKEAERHG
ncbi:YrbL family protein [Microbulbifer yueqingensis]|uniref:PhoP regulatory network protein YrbL n=1 Tax=Microbulbifer yueqingensis TaxID=658219 RepID=A0A1G8YCM6_9GAMM|nr:YrbL family protein [Microbulbifer yueqingensis]SDJ99985.1 PhoP regulatory network protein YrbL [Microbulbifer yueqingensis]